MSHQASPAMALSAIATSATVAATPGSRPAQPARGLSQGRKSAAAQPQPIRLTRRGRRVVAALIALPITALIALGSAHRAAAADQIQFGTVVVQPGQNLWEIAAAIDPAADPRATIYTIEQLNGLQSSSVAVGQLLIVPAIAQG